MASALVPSALRPAVVALYRYARAADDLADEGDATPAQRLEALAAFARALDAIEAQRSAPEADTPPFPALAEAIRRHGLPIPPLRDLLSAFSQDVTVHRYASWAELADYCRRSANPVGRTLLALYRADTPQRRAWSDAVCTGLQLANFWQDVAIDWRKDRVYLPREDLDRFGVTEDDIAHARGGERWRALMAFETARARTLLIEGSALARELPWRLGLELRAVVAGGLRILARIDSVGGDVFTRRPTLTPLDWGRVAFRAVIPQGAAA